MTNEVRHVYDGLLTVQERDANNLAMVSYTRGNDLSGTRQGAGGIGGLLARTDHSALHTPQSALAHAYYHCGGNGNVTALVDTNGFIVARYQYDPYGNLLGMSGPLAEANAYRFSSKEWCANAGLYYYGFRFYEPNLQRWPNRDPSGDQSGMITRKKLRLQAMAGWNLYEFCFNAPVVIVDTDGRLPHWLTHGGSVVLTWVGLGGSVATTRQIRLGMLMTECGINSRPANAREHLSIVTASCAGENSTPCPRWTADNATANVRVRQFLGMDHLQSRPPCRILVA